MRKTLIGSVCLLMAGTVLSTGSALGYSVR
jgi:hypothetical protein